MMPTRILFCLFNQKLCFNTCASDLMAKFVHVDISFFPYLTSHFCKIYVLFTPVKYKILIKQSYYFEITTREDLIWVVCMCFFP